MNKEPHKSSDLSSSRMNYGKQTWILHEVGFQIQKVLVIFPIDFQLVIM